MIWRDGSYSIHACHFIVVIQGCPLCVGCSGCIDPLSAALGFIFPSSPLNQFVSMGATEISSHLPTRHKKNKRKRQSSVDSSSVRDYFKKPAANAPAAPCDQYTTDLEQAIQLSLTESTGREQSSSSVDANNQQLCPVCDRCFDGSSPDQFTRHVNHCLDTPQPPAESSSSTWKSILSSIPDSISRIVKGPSVIPEEESSDDVSPELLSDSISASVEPVIPKTSPPVTERQGTNGTTTIASGKKEVPFYKWVQG